MVIGEGGSEVHVPLLKIIDELSASSDKYRYVRTVIL